METIQKEQAKAAEEINPSVALEVGHVAVRGISYAGEVPVAPKAPSADFTPFPTMP